MVLQVFGCIISLVTLATVLVSFQKSLRLSLPTKAKLSFPGMAIQFMWRVCTIASRVLAFALFASYFRFYVFVAAAVHWMVMMVWVSLQETMYCMLRDRDGRHHHSRGFEFCFRILAAFVHIFCFFNLIEGHTRLRCVLYYTIVYVENLAMVMTWYVVASTNDQPSWYFVPGVVCVLVIFWVGIGFQVVYYLCCHPNNDSVLHVRKRIRVCVKCPELSLIKDLDKTTPTKMEYTGEDAAQEAALSARGSSYVDNQQLMTGPQGSWSQSKRSGPMANVRRVPSNSSSNSSMPRPVPRTYKPQISSQRQVYRPQQSPHGNGAGDTAEVRTGATEQQSMLHTAV